MTEAEEHAIELLLSDPEIVAWLDPSGRARDDRAAAEDGADDERPEAA
jgi:hypothetical protein